MIESLIEKYGYVALAIGILLEGEAVLVVAGFLAHRGLLALSLVLTVAIAFTLIADQTLFWIGRRHGMELLRRRPEWQRRSAWIRKLLRRHGNLTAIGFRFLYGARVVTPLLLGASGYSPWRFVPLNVLGATVWVTTYAILGWFFGDAMTRVLVQVGRFDEWVILGIAVLVSAVLAVRWWRRKRAEARDAALAADTDDQPTASS